MGEANHDAIAPLFDSSNWLPIAEVHRRLCPSVGERCLAARDMTDKFEDGSIRTLRRWLLRRGRANPRLTDRRLWGAKFELSSWSDGLYVAYRDSAVARLARLQVVQVRLLKGYVFYAWLPDLAKVWPSIFGPMLPLPAPPLLEPQPQAPPPNAPRPDTGAQEREQRSEVTGVPAATEDRDAITATTTAVSEPVAGTAKAYFKKHPQGPDETDSEYINRLHERSKQRWEKKTLQNVLYESRRQPRG